MRHSVLWLVASFLFVAAVTGSAWSDGPAGAKKYLIIHSDDAGMSHSANIGTIDAMENGIVSSASIMVPCPWFPEIAEYARANPDRDFGVHLTLNCEWKYYRWGPVASRDRVPSLLDPDGYMWRSTDDVRKHVRLEEAAIELRAQIDRAKQFGVPITHLDTHMGAVMTRPDLLELYVQLGIEYDLPVLFLKDFNEQLAQEHPGLAALGREMLARLESSKLPVLDHLVQIYGDPSDRTRRDAYLDALRNVKPGVSQLIVHCGYDDAELRAITSSAARRDEDRRVFSDPEVAALLRDMQVEVITWKQFREMSQK